MNQIENQPSLIELLQSKTADNMKYIEEQMGDLETELVKYFEIKKQDSARMNFLSNQDLMKAYCAASAFGNTGEMDEFLKKCFRGVKSLQRNDTKET